MSDEKDKTEAKEASAAQPVAPQPAATPDQQNVELTVCPGSIGAWVFSIIKGVL